MIVVCEKCKTTFLVPSSAFVRGARTLHCARCGHSWAQQPPPAMRTTQKEKDQAELAAMELRPIPARPRPPPHEDAEEMEKIIAPEEHASILKETLQTIRPGQTDIVLKTIAKGREKFFKHRKTFTGIAASFLVLVMVGVAVTESGMSFDRARAFVWPSQEDEVVIQNIKAQRRLVGDTMRLTIHAAIANHAKRAKTLSPVRIEALNEKRQIVANWTTALPKTVISNGKTMNFSFSIPAPDDSIVEVSLSFLRPPHDN